MSKADLKQIKELIKKRDFSRAVEMCQDLLEQNPANHILYLLLGAAYQKTDKNMAAKNLREYLKYYPEDISALQGLANCAATNELPNIYEKLLLISPENKLMYYERLCSISIDDLAIEPCIEVFRGQLKNASGGDREVILKYLIQIWRRCNFNVPKKDISLLKEALAIVIEDEHFEKRKLCHSYFIELLLKDGEFFNCLDLSIRYADQFPQDGLGYEYLCEIYYELHYQRNLTRWSKLAAPVEFYYDKLKALKPDSSIILFMNAFFLFDRQQFLAARNTLQGFLDIRPTHVRALQMMANIYVELGAQDLAILYLKTMEVHLRNSSSTFCETIRNKCNVSSTYLYEPESESLEGRYPIEVAHISKMKGPFYTYLDYGKLCFSNGQYFSALVNVLKATRIRPFYSECYYCLGCIYIKICEITRARICLEKCIYINPLNLPAVKMLSNIYQQLGNHTENGLLLLNTLKKCDSLNLKDILYNLGHHYLNIKKWENAIHFFRAAIKCDVNCVLFWETLGYAYMQRGSYNSAIRVFQKLLKMNPHNLYAELEMASAKSTVKLYTNAIEDFEILLERHPNYLPGLKAASETHIGWAKALESKHCIGRCKTHLQMAANLLERAFSRDKSHCMIWVWRNLAKLFIKMAKLPESMASLEVVTLFKSTGNTVKLNRRNLLELALRFHICALRLNPSAVLWYELAECSYLCANFIDSDKAFYLNLSWKSCLITINMDYYRWQTWNLLGLIYMHSDIPNYALAQHCFIQALEKERKSFITWTNIGILYLILDNIMLANKCFQRAQQSNPTYHQAWVGQAMVAEIIGEHEECLDLFRHCQKFDYLSESALGYSFWVSMTVVNNGTKSISNNYIEKLINSEIAALDAITWYVACEENNSSVAGLSYNGYLNARGKLFRPAINAFLRAASNSIVKAEHDSIYTTLGYLFLKQNQLEESINAFYAAPKTRLDVNVGLALALFYANHIEEAYCFYNAALRISKNKEKSSMILLALSSVIYALQGLSDTKNILCQSLLHEDTPVETLYAACALCILHRDDTFSETILTELKSRQHLKKCVDHIAFLVSFYYAKNNQINMGLSYIKGRVHSFPDSAKLREVLAIYIGEYYSKSFKLSLSTSQTALTAVMLERGDKTQRSKCGVESGLFLVAGRAIRCLSVKRSRILIQQSIHLHPYNIDAWNELHADLNSEWSTTHFPLTTQKI